MQQQSTDRAEPALLPEINLQKIYLQRVEAHQIRQDSVQLQLLGHFQNLNDKLIVRQQYQQQPGWSKLFASKPPKCKSLYLYGDVGCGKTMLMDLFYEFCPYKKKRRIHFYVFMQEVHQSMHELRQQHIDQLMEHLAQRIYQKYELICFDEFHVTDIADAMILGRLFEQLFTLGLVLVATSNRHPNTLYKGGLQRELFLPFIDLLKKTADIKYLVTASDYRISHRHIVENTYFSPLNENAELFMQVQYQHLTKQSDMHAGAILVTGREVTLSVVYKDLLMISFEELCERALGAADYLIIAQHFNTVLMSGIPRFLPEHRNEAKRFVTLIDVLYDHKIKFICTAAVKPAELYQEGDGKFEFARTVSRLMEMQSRRYLEQSSP